jgi:hypothetical protein
MTIALLKDTARLFCCAAADMDFHDCMIFSSLQIFKFVCIFGISKFYMNFMNLFPIMHRASELAKSRITFVWRICMEAQNGLCLPACPSRLSGALNWT